mmetsp:Transcript_85073/g.238215  ORF Transcript_85073/g.238215 Transcript_85073/m.238215 type:complete len:385 (-) Transcript_85073:308-1462(-)
MFIGARAPLLHGLPLPQSPRGHGAARICGLLLHGERQLQRLLLPALHHLLPELALVPDAVKLALNVLLRDLKQPQHGVIRLLAHEVEDAPVLLRRLLAPHLLNTCSQILRAVLPVQELHVHIQLLLGAVVHPRPWEDSDDLAEFNGAPREFRDVVLQGLEALLIHLLVEFFVHSVDVLLQPLLVLRSLPLQLAQVIAVLADVHIVSGALHGQAVDLVSHLVNVTLRFATSALQAADTEVQGVQPLRRLLRDIRMVTLDAIDAIIDLLMEIVILLAQRGLHLRDASLGLCVPFVDLTMDVLVGLGVLHGDHLQLSRLRLLRLKTLRDLRVRLLHEALLRLVVGVHLVDYLPDLTADLIQRLVHLSPPAVHLQTQRRRHVAHCLDG